MAGIDARRATLFTLIVALGLPAGPAATARERDWYQYENSHFVAYSNESGKTVTKLLTELEYFRAAVLQSASIEPPEDAPKVGVIIFRTVGEFQTFIGSNRIGGIASNINGELTMLLAAGSDRRQTNTILRHEYAHVILAYKNFPFPMWFNEGFAELMSATKTRKNYTQFSIGDDPGRTPSQSNLQPLSAILSRDFNPHSLKSARRASDAYLQSWLLVHYFMLGNQPANQQLLVQYFARLAVGEDPVAAFEAVVGESADEFGKNLVRNYAAPYFVVDFLAPDVDLHFARAFVDSAQLSSVLEPFRGGYRTLELQ
jgi:hypothetical protein